MKSLKRNPFVFGGAVSALVLVFAAWMLATPTAAESPRLERYLPAETIGFVEVNNLRQQALQVMESEAWRAFTQNNQGASALFMMGANHTGALDASYAVALVGAGEGARQPQFVLVAEFTSAEARKTFENRALRLLRGATEGKTETAAETYSGVSIHSLGAASRAQRAAYAQVGDTLFVSNSTEAIKKVLDVQAGRAKSLEANARFVEARAKAPYAGGLFGFLDAAALARLIEAVPAEGRQGVAAFRQLFQGAGADSVQSVALTSSFVEGRVAERVVVTAEDKGAGLLHMLSSNPPTSQALVALVPEDALQIFDASIGNAAQSFDELTTLLNQVAEQHGKKTVAEGLRELTEKTKVDVRGEIIGALGAEVCLAQLPSEGGTRAGVLIVNLKEPARFASAVAKAAEFKGQPITTRDYKGVQMTRTQRHGRPHFYAMLGNNFVASDNERAVERVIETAQGGRSLAASSAYRAASASAPANPLFVYYHSNADYLSRLNGMLLGGHGAKSPEGAQGASLRPSFAYGVAQGGGFIFESRTPLGTFPRLLALVTAKMGRGHGVKSE
jgi:nucleotide-binding universal stress UspA family protein